MSLIRSLKANSGLKSLATRKEPTSPRIYSCGLSSSRYGNKRMDSNSSSFHHSSYNCSSPDSETNSNQELLNSSTLEDQIRQSNNQVCIYFEKAQSSTFSLEFLKTLQQIGTVILYGVPIVSLMMETKERLCLAQISSTLLKDYSYNVSRTTALRCNYKEFNNFYKI